MSISYETIIIFATNLTSIKNYDKYLDRFISPIYDIEKKIVCVKFAWPLWRNSAQTGS